VVWGGWKRKKKGGCESKIEWVGSGFFFLWWGGGGGGGVGWWFCALSLVLKIQTKGSSPFSVLFVDETYYSGTFIPKLSPPNLRFQPILQSVSTATIDRFDKPGSFPFWGKIFPHNLTSLPTTTEVLDKLFCTKKTKAMGGGNGWCISSSQSWMLCSEKREPCLNYLWGLRGGPL